MSNYVCSKCGAAAYYDGRCGDGPVLICECRNRGRWINDGRGGYRDNDAQPVESDTQSWDRDDD
jgi:hypothetical protein